MFKPIYTVNYNGLEEPFCSLYDIARFCVGLTLERHSFDVWMDDTLLASYTYNDFTGSYDVTSLVDGHAIKP